MTAQDFGLEGAISLVTGAASGIGRATVRRLLAEGAVVMATDRNLLALEEVRKMDEAKEAGGRLVLQALDVTREDDWAQAVDQLVRTHETVDVLVNCAGVSGARPLIDEDLAHWQHILGVNLDGAMLGIRHAGRVMVETGGGVIVNVASASGVRPVPGAAAYSVSKAAVRALTKVAASEFAQAGVRINTVSPGGTATPMWTSQEWWPEHLKEAGSEEAAWNALAEATPMQRFAEAGEVAEAIVWLASPRSGYATGAEIVLDGGFSL